MFLFFFFSLISIMTLKERKRREMHSFSSGTHACGSWAALVLRLLFTSIFSKKGVSLVPWAGEPGPKEPKWGIQALTDGIAQSGAWSQFVHFSVFFFSSDAKELLLKLCVARWFSLPSVLFLFRGLDNGVIRRNILFVDSPRPTMYDLFFSATTRS